MSHTDRLILVSFVLSKRHLLNTWSIHYLLTLTRMKKSNRHAVYSYLVYISYLLTHHVKMMAPSCDSNCQMVIFMCEWDIFVSFALSVFCITAILQTILLCDLKLQSIVINCTLALANTIYCKFNRLFSICMCSNFKFNLIVTLVHVSTITLDQLKACSTQRKIQMWNFRVKPSASNDRMCGFCLYS